MEYYQKLVSLLLLSMLSTVTLFIAFSCTILLVLPQHQQHCYLKSSPKSKFIITYRFCIKDFVMPQHYLQLCCHNDFLIKVTIYVQVIYNSSKLCGVIYLPFADYQMCGYAIMVGVAAILPYLCRYVDTLGRLCHECLPCFETQSLQHLQGQLCVLAYFLPPLCRRPKRLVIKSSETKCNLSANQKLSSN